MRLTNQITCLAAFLFIATCAYGQDVHYNYDRNANFAAYKTYQWVDTPTAAPKSDPASAPKVNAGALPNLSAAPPIFFQGIPNSPAGSSEIRDNASEDQLINQEIKRAVDEQLARKGLIKVDKNADIEVGYHAAIRQERSLYVSGMGWGGRGNSSVQGQTSSIPIGTIVVDLYDRAQKQLIWRGDTTRTIDLKKDPDKNYKNLQEAMAKLFRNYPHPPTK